MPIAFKSGSHDNGAAGTRAKQLTVPRPPGVVDGDFLIACLSLDGGPAVNVISVPPGWTLLRRTNEINQISQVLYYKFASNEPASGGTWSLDTLGIHCAAVLAYSGVDSFFAIDAESPNSGFTAFPITGALVSSTAGVAVAFYSVSGGDNIVSGPAGYVRRMLQVQNNTAIDVFDSQISAGSIPVAQGAIGSPDFYAADLLVLRPSSARSMLEQVRSDVKNMFPPGAGDFYDWDNREADVFRITQAEAQFSKSYGYDYIDLLAQEFQPATCTLKQSDWEAVLGLSPNFLNALNSFTANRRTKIISKLRERGAFTLPNIRAAIEPLLGYQGADVGTLQVIECNRAALTALHTQTINGISVTPSSSTTQSFAVSDDPIVSAFGAMIVISPTASIGASALTITLTAPDATFKTWTYNQTFNSGTDLYFYAPSLSGSAIRGIWSLQVINSSGSTVSFNASLFVEGAGLDSAGGSGLGTAIFHWGVLAEFSKVNNPDYVSVRSALSRITPAFAVPHLLFQTNGGAGEQSLAIPDDPFCLPDSVIPG